MRITLTGCFNEPTVPGGTLTITRTCAGVSSGPPATVNNEEYRRVGTLNVSGGIDQNGSGGGTHEQRVRIQGTVTVCRAGVCPGPRLVVEAPTFGTCASTSPLVMRNVGATPLTINWVTTPQPPFYLAASPLPITLAPGQASSAVVVAFEPQIPDDYKNPRDVQGVIRVEYTEDGVPGDPQEVRFSARIRQPTVTIVDRYRGTDPRENPAGDMYVENIVTVDCNPRLLDAMVAREKLITTSADFPWILQVGVTSRFYSAGDFRPTPDPTRRLLPDVYSFSDGCRTFDCASRAWLPNGRAEGGRWVVAQQYEWAWVGTPEGAAEDGQHDSSWYRVQGKSSGDIVRVVFTKADRLPPFYTWWKSMSVWGVGTIERECNIRGCHIQ
jgi:hypothetical protein